MSLATNPAGENPTCNNARNAAPAATRGRGTMQRRILALVAGLNVASTMVACAIAYNFQKTAFLHGVDRLLTGGAIGAQLIYGDEFHREFLAGKQFSAADGYAHIVRVSDLAQRLGLNYVSAVVRRDGKYCFSISSSPPHELEDGTYDRIGTPYDPSAALIATFNDGKIRFEEHDDHYGSFRSVYIPHRLPGSDRVDYVYVSDIGLDYIYSHLHETLAKTAFACLVISVFSLWLTWILARHVAKPMAKLAALIRAVVGPDFRIGDEQRTSLVRVADESYEEVSDVATAFCRMEGRLQHYITELQHTTAERERIASELSIAHDIQMGLLPRTLPQVPGCDVFARVIPAKEVGGDLFEVAALDEHRLLVAVADVSGKGISAGMFMAVTKTLLDAARSSCDQPDELAKFLNDHLSAENDACMFVTMFLGVFDVRTGRLHYTNAGHNPPYILRENGQLDTLAERHGMALGIAGGQTYGSDVTRLALGDLLVMFSDGITEAQNAAEALFSEERLEACLCEMALPTACQAAAAVIGQVSEFQGAAPQFDDITLVTLRYTEQVPAALAHDKPLALHA